MCLDIPEQWTGPRETKRRETGSCFCKRLCRAYADTSMVVRHGGVGAVPHGLNALDLET